VASAVIKQASHHNVEEYIMPRQFPPIGPAIRDERFEYAGQIVVLRRLDELSSYGASRWAIVRPDGELALAFERETALNIAADYFSHGQA